MTSPWVPPWGNFVFVEEDLDLGGNEIKFSCEREGLGEMRKVLDPFTGNWRSIASIGTNMASYDAAVLNGKLLVNESWLWPFYVSPRGQVYDPRTDN
ncbi:hypothetical protein Ahy_A03g014636 [Arachis hypogaea]|uniref:Uncharacterized protein n=1 Tax=Arachis hypogaea TaxID=3818 RepID=A0A445DYA3_ARAHY|nr:hypothetical protein Ahy_A03g014636 [Arachis hypogaea]